MDQRALAQRRVRTKAYTDFAGVNAAVGEGRAAFRNIRMEVSIPLLEWVQAFHL
jgi:hypothetical protein